jgi:hypothetical protein
MEQVKSRERTLSSVIELIEKGNLFAVNDLSILAKRRWRDTSKWTQTPIGTEPTIPGAQ